LVEHFLGKEEVTSSILVVSSTVPGFLCEYSYDGRIEPCVISLLLSVANANAATTRPRKTNGFIPVGWSIRSIAGGARSTRRTRKRNNAAYASGSIGRAAVSKTAGWGFESLLACTLMSGPASSVTMKEQIISFVVDVNKELKKVTWPKREELRESTIVVIAVSGIITVFVFVADFVIGKLINAILGA
jgi:preprotein translocase subunit SecE